jgi:hypothetical protein
MKGYADRIKTTRELLKVAGLEASDETAAIVLLLEGQSALADAVLPHLSKIEGELPILRAAIQALKR